jgi:hypothetical protein
MQSLIRQLIEPAKTIFTLSIPERLKLEPNDLDNGARLLSVEGNNIIYVLGKGWAVWDGSKFGFRGGKLKARKIATTLRNIVLEEAEAAWDAEIDVATLQKALENELKKRNPAFTDHDGARRFLCGGKVAKLIRHATKCGNARTFETALKVCEHQVSVDITELDQNPWSFIVPNGVIDLKRVVDTKIQKTLPAKEAVQIKRSWLRETNRAKRPTKSGGVPFDPSATCPEWEALIELVLPHRAVRMLQTFDWNALVRAQRKSGRIIATRWRRQREVHRCSGYLSCIG